MASVASTVFFNKIDINEKFFLVMYKHGVINSLNQYYRTGRMRVKMNRLLAM